MKYRILFGALAATVVIGAFAWPTLANWKQNARRRAAMDIPQAERALRVPAPQKVRAAFPNNSRSVLEQSRQLILFSVEPRESFGHAKRPFHDHEILGQIIITDPTVKSALLASLYDGLVPAQGNNIAFGCFNPRHGVRATHNDKTVDLLICFRCRQFNVYLNNKQITRYTFITNAPQPMFDQILTAANIPISK